MSHWRVSILAALLASAAVGAVAQTPKPATGNLTIAFAAEATVLDPAKSSAGVDQHFFRQIYEQLARPDPSSGSLLKKVNWLAESWSIEDEGGKPVIDVHLRKGVRAYPENWQPFEVTGLVSSIWRFTAGFGVSQAD